MYPFLKGILYSPSGSVCNTFIKVLGLILGSHSLIYIDYFILGPELAISRLFSLPKMQIVSRALNLLTNVKAFMDKKEITNFSICYFSVLYSVVCYIKCGHFMLPTK